MYQSLISPSLNHIPSVSTGRRFCTSPHHQGQRWLPVCYFHVSEWIDDHKAAPKRMQAHCKTCQVINQRKHKGHQPRKPSTTGYKRDTPEAVEAYRKYQQRRYANMTPRQREERRVRERIRAESRRRAAGIKPRNLKRLQQPGTGHLRPQEGEPTFDAEPLSEFLTEMVHRHGVTAVATATKLGKDRIEALADAQDPTVSLELADRVLTGLGYPELLASMYPEEE